jgi:hypothetical protein
MTVLAGCTKINRTFEVDSLVLWAYTSPQQTNGFVHGDVVDTESMMLVATITWDPEHVAWRIKAEGPREVPGVAGVMRTEGFGPGFGIVRWFETADEAIEAFVAARKVVA